MIITGKNYFDNFKDVKIKNVKINYHNPFVSRLEAAFARADESLGKFIWAIYKKGAYLTSWDENLDYSLWEETAEECGLSFEKEASFCVVNSCTVTENADKKVLSYINNLKKKHLFRL